MAKGRKPVKGTRYAREEEDSDSSASEEETKPAERRVGKQSSNVGMMPPSDSESGSDEEDEKPAPEKAKAAGGGQPATAGTLPPSDSEDEDEDDEDEDDDDDEPAGPARCATRPRVALGRLGLAGAATPPVAFRAGMTCSAARRPLSRDAQRAQH